MLRIALRSRFVAALVLLATLTATGILIKPHTAYAFSLPRDIIIFDPVSVPSGEGLELHIVNQLVSDPINIQAVCRPSSILFGSPISGPVLTVGPGQASHQSFPFLGFGPPAGVTRIPVICAVFLTQPTGSLPRDWPGRVLSSIETVDNVTNKPTAFTASRHIVINANPCLDCN